MISGTTAMISLMRRTVLTVSYTAKLIEARTYKTALSLKKGSLSHKKLCYNKLNEQTSIDA